MLKLTDIKKDYVIGDSCVHALKGVSLEFRKSEFVSILGQSGCGKTTLLNIIGGLDQYTSGNLIINGKSTKIFDDRDWDTYRNHSVGFVFQSYNLIPHQTVLANVELALTLSGVSKEERRKRATEALITVGLGEQLKKKPNQLSGGQMQRVAIARALVNDPDILLADEPTGALDSETSVQIMELLKAISNDKLIIMVTHNPELAEQYSTRIINLLDGLVVSDSNPYTAPQAVCTEQAPPSSLEYKINCKMERTVKENAFNAMYADLKDKDPAEAKAKKIAFKEELAKEAEEQAKIYAQMREDEKQYKKAKKQAEKDAKIALANELAALPPEVRAQRLSEIKAQKEAEKAALKAKKKAERKTSMSFFTALSLSLNNLLTKKGRTFLTAFAGSIGIIGIALILSVSSGVNSYITSIEESTMSSYPLQINESTVDTMSIISAMMNNQGVENPDENTVYSNDVMTTLMDSITTSFSKNNLTDFKKYIDSNQNFKDNATDIKYVYSANLNTYRIVGGIEKYRQTLNGIGGLLNEIGLGEMFSMTSTGSMAMGSGAFTELVGNSEYIESQYDKLYGKYPTKENEVVLIVDGKQQVSDFILYVLGIRDTRDLENYIQTRLDTDPSNDFAIPKASYSFEEICGYKFKVLPDAQKYKVEDGKIVLRSNEEINAFLDSDKAITLEVVGIVTASESSASSSAIGSIGYTSGLMSTVIKQSNDSEIVTLQQNNTTTDLLTGLPFAGFNPDATFIREYLKLAAAQMGDMTALLNMSDSQLLLSLKEIILSDPAVKNLLTFQYDEGSAPYGGYTVNDINTVILPAFENISDSQIKSFAQMIYAFSLSGCPVTDVNGNVTGYIGGDPTGQNFIKIINTMLSDSASYTADQAHLNALKKLGYVDFDKPTSILIYPKDFASKDAIKAYIEEYNNSQKNDDDKISYTDTVALLMDSVTTIVDAISYVLVAFVAISLIVSSIMIGIITYISVLERTKEIGVLRAIGASKKDVSRVFNAETLIVGFAAGLLGIIVSLIFIVIIKN